MKHIRLIFILAFASMIFRANKTFPQQNNRGSLSGGFETNSIYYVPDSKLDGYSAPKDRVCSNNLLNLDYTIRNYSAGIQYEIYTPVLQGFSPDLKGGKIINKYFGWVDKKLAVTVGDFYEQSGSGIILRTYEDRALGFNNAIEGVRVLYNYNNYFKIKGVWGSSRLYMDYADVRVRGADVSFSISDLVGWKKDIVSAGGSFVNRFEEKLSEITNVGSPNTNMWASRITYENHTGFYMRGEYIKKKGEIAAGIEDYEEISGNGQLVEVGYNGRNLGISATYIRIKNFNLRVMLEDNSINNVLNYLPSLTRQSAVRRQS